MISVYAVFLCVPLLSVLCCFHVSVIPFGSRIFLVKFFLLFHLRQSHFMIPIIRIHRMSALTYVVKIYLFLHSSAFMCRSVNSLRTSFHQKHHRGSSPVLGNWYVTPDPGPQR
ncbi:hypothetical protein K435DRAFT_73152 [Dendrothele bispora CBS 962.96]|uniref:Uncharacterized protein n=1 Tax=Dendrothele bispora (strain CBS 962.96) TaxID=1314807 RepID=A0A4S8M4Z6_DENBC|nr:hypothetical protein K435DRAFT_73152 [Dendrothele bispora CBS 962.96]